MMIGLSGEEFSKLLEALAESLEENKRKGGRTR